MLQLVMITLAHITLPRLVQTKLPKAGQYSFELTNGSPVYIKLANGRPIYI